ncbi:MAG TPA: hypothetical protein VN641_00790 [Urbifossiella sp.]|nr:hypothetical protein [Urbifossiella sp.]
MFLLGEGFWSFRNAVDWIAVVGLVLALFSIWLTWWLAKQDLEKRIRSAQRDLVERLSGMVLQNDIVEASRYLQEARELCRRSQWERALDRCEQAMHRVPRFRFLPGLHPDDLPRLDELVDKLLSLARQVGDIMQARNKRTELSPSKWKDLDEMILVVAAIEGKIRALSLR